jgi:hypothetical protein
MIKLADSDKLKLAEALLTKMADIIDTLQISVKEASALKMKAEKVAKMERVLESFTNKTGTKFAKDPGELVEEGMDAEVVEKVATSVFGESVFDGSTADLEKKSDDESGLSDFFVQFS